MTQVVLETDGRLRGFLAVPSALDDSKAPWPEPDYSPLFQAAGIDPSTLRAVEPRWAASVDSDRKAAWEGPYPGQPGLEVHVGGSERPSFRLAESGQSEEFEKVGTVLRIRIESLRPSVRDDRFELLEGWGQSDRLFPLRRVQMSSRGHWNDSVAHREREKFFQAGDIEIAGSGAEAVA